LGTLIRVPAGLVAMGLLGIVFFPVGFFLAIVGLVLVTDAPFMRDILKQVEFLRKNNRLAGTAIALLGFLLMALS
jgi:hypothetical protein